VKFAVCADSTGTAIAQGLKAMAVAATLANKTAWKPAVRALTLMIPH
jgi:hypothetical protein